MLAVRTVRRVVATTGSWGTPATVSIIAAKLAIGNVGQVLVHALDLEAEAAVKSSSLPIITST